MLIRRLRRAGHRDGLVVDLGCGGGIAARLLADAGYRVLGVDLSPHLLQIARRRVPEGRFVEGSLLDAELPPCCGVAALGEVVNYLADPRGGPEALRTLARRARAALAPGGVLLLDVAEPGREPAGAPRRAWHEGDDWLLALEAGEDLATGLLRRRITVFRDTGAAWRRSEEVHTLRPIPRAVALAELTAAGLAPRVLAGYGRELRFRRGHVGIAATPA